MGSHRGIGRVTLTDVVDFQKNGIRKSLFEKHTLQEPTFREILLLYRPLAPPSEPTKTLPAASTSISSPPPSEPSTPRKAASQPSTPRSENRSEPSTPRSPGDHVSSGSSKKSNSIRSPSSLLTSTHRHHKDGHKEHKEHRDDREHRSKKDKSSGSTERSSGSKVKREKELNEFNPLAIQIKTCARCLMFFFFPSFC